MIMKKQDIRKNKKIFTLIEDATYLGACNNVRHCAFTLAEVLITLGVIGVVAAMTIPTLVANYQEKSWNTSASVFERKLEEALKVMNTQQTLAGYTTTESFVNELRKHIKIVKTCDNTRLQECFPSNFDWQIIDISNGSKVSNIVDISTIKQAKNMGKGEWDTNVVGVQFGNGVSGLLAYDPSCRQDPYSNQIVGTSCISIAYDVSGFGKPNTFGKDIRGLNAILGKCTFKDGETCFGAPFYPGYMTYEECAGDNVISPNTPTASGSEASNLGIAACYTEKDYWAGAVKACGGVSKMPSLTQLATLGNYVYNTDTISEDSMYSGGLEVAKASSLGLLLMGDGNQFVVWTNQEGTSSGDAGGGLSYYRIFGRGGTMKLLVNRAATTAQAFCIVP